MAQLKVPIVTNHPPKNTMNLKQLTLTTTIVLLSAIPAAIATPLKAPTFSIATDKPMANLPHSGASFIPSNRPKNHERKPIRGLICTPSQPVEDCDRRIPMDSRAYPWSAIGRLQIGENAHCTATLIADQWILTNAHCVVDRTTHQIESAEITFLPNLIDGKLQSEDDRAKVTDIIVGTDFSDNDAVVQPNDWAILKLDRPLGQTHGTIGWKAIPSNLLIKNRQKFTLAGYSYDFPNPEKYPEFSAGAGFTAGLHEKCSFTDEQVGGVLVHDCNMRAGSSGSAIIAWINEIPYIVGINSAEQTNTETGEGYENYAVNVNQLDTWIMRQNRDYRPTESTTK
jgi:protease YdgD